jgi:Uma2 family endonuclease
MTAREFLALPEDGWRYELVRGRLVRMSPTGFEHSNIAWNLLRALDSFVNAHGLGTVTIPEAGFIISRAGEPDTVLAPDAAFIPKARMPRPGSPDWKGFPRLAPDLVVEIASPSQSRPDLAAKAGLWLSAGVRLVWAVWPERREVDVWRPGSTNATTLGPGDQLDGEDVLPDFVYPIGSLFT